MSKFSKLSEKIQKKQGISSKTKFQKMASHGKK